MQRPIRVRKIVVLCVVLLALVTYLFAFGEAERPSQTERHLSGDDLLEVLSWMLATYVVNLSARYYLRRRVDVPGARKIPAIVVHLMLTVMYVVVVFVVVGRLFQKDIGTLLVTSGAISLFIGFVLRDTILDFFTGISINLDESVETGSLVRVHLKSSTEFTGWISNISWRATTLTTVRNESVILPNRELGYATIVRLTEPVASVEAVETLRFAHDANVDEVLELIGNALEHAWLSGLIRRDPAFFARIASIDRDGIGVAVGFQYDPSTYSPSAVRHEVLYRVHGHLKHAGVLPVQPALLELSSRDASKARFETDTLSPLIDSIDLFVPLSSDERTALALAAIRRPLERGRMIVSEGDPGGSMFIVASGVVRISRTVDGNEVDLAVLGPGDYFGEMSLLTGHRRNASVQAGSRCVLFELTKDAIAPALRSNAQLAAALSRLVARRQAEHDSRVGAALRGDGPRENHSGLLRRISDYFDIRKARD